MKKGLLIAVAILLLGISIQAELQEISGKSKTDFRSAKMYLKQQNYEKAMPFYEKVLAENPHHIESLFAIAGVYYDIDKNYKKAYATYANILEAIDMVYAEYEEIKAADEKKGKKYYKTWIKKADLEDKQEKAISLKQNCWALMLQNGIQKYQEEDYQGALEYISVLYELTPDSVKTIKLLGNCYFKLGNEEEGIKYYEEAYKLSKPDETTASLIAYKYSQLENIEKSIIWYSNAIEDNPENAENYYNLGVTYSNVDENEKAFEMFKKTLDYEPTNDDAIYNAKIFAQKLGLIDEYVNFYQMEFDRDGYDAATVRVFCYQLNNMEAYEHVLTYGQKWAELEPEETAPYQLMYAAATKLGRKDLAAEYLKKFQ